MRAARLALPAEERREAEAALSRHLQASGLLRKYKTVAGYVPVRGEADILPILLSSGGGVALPCIEEHNRMVFRRLSPNNRLTEGKHGIPCPADGEEIIPELILLPLLACDRRGVRLGAGGGYYDRLLTQPAYRESHRIGVGFAFQFLPRLPEEPHDVTVRAFLSEQGLVECKQT